MTSLPELDPYRLRTFAVGAPPDVRAWDR